MGFRGCRWTRFLRNQRGDVLSSDAAKAVIFARGMVVGTLPDFVNWFIHFRTHRRKAGKQ
jgi:hypothetical protein